MKQLLVVVFIVFSCSLFSQQMPQYSQWSTNHFALNPAHAGIKSCLEVHSLVRLQWIGFDGAPKSGFFNLSLPLPAKRQHFLSARQGFGIRFEADQIGPYFTNRYGVSYAGHFNFSQNTRLSLGVNAGIIQMGYDPSKSITIAPDPTISKELSLTLPDASFGAWWNGENYYIGLVLNNLLRSRWTDFGTDARFRFHTLLYAGTRLKVSDKITLLPAALLKIPPAGPVAIDIQGMFDFQKRLSLGLGWRNTDALILFAGIKLNPRFTVNYSADIVLSAINNQARSSHEISLVFTGCVTENTGTLKCPLF
ncbi:MAG: type IX secretion system membrane protein PorP/SprF [Crocinitomicaceae bacterium]|nr:type IX secretion system membrane protein PorP/SprF [Crocinitomicaceae bacterium]